MPDWRALRKALGLSQAEMASLLAIGERSYRRIEASPHRCPAPRVVMFLRLLLSDPVHVAQLAFAEFPHPFPSDLERPFFWARSIGPRCSSDGLPLLVHPRCVGCGALVGPGHAIAQVDGAQLCPSCRRSAEIRARDAMGHR